MERALASHAAHELRTPLAPACLQLETALARKLPSRQDVQASLIALKLLCHRTGRLLQLSRAESASIESLTEINLVQLAGVVAQEFWDAKATPSKLMVPEHDLPAVLGDLVGLSIVLRNLLDNALCHGGAACVVIEVMVPSTLAVRDFGPGVPAERLHAESTAPAPGFQPIGLWAGVVDRQDGCRQTASTAGVPLAATRTDARI